MPKVDEELPPAIPGESLFDYLERTVNRDTPPPDYSEIEVDPEILRQVQEFTAMVRQLNPTAREATNALRISHGEVTFLKLEIFDTGYYEYVSKPDRVGPVAPEFEVKEGHTWLMLRDGHSPLLMLYRDGEWRVKEHEDNMVKEAKAIAESSRMSFKQALELVRSGQEYVIDLDGTVLIIVEAEN